MKSTFSSTVAALRKHYGPAPKPLAKDPFHLILWEQVGYLCTDQVRLKAFQTLKKEVGLEPEDIVAAPRATLLKIARMGGAMAAAERADRMRESAERVIGDWGGDLNKALELPEAQARKALMAFRMVGEPGADKILAIAGKNRRVPLDSNALRVVQRLGFSKVAKDYRAQYRAAQEALLAEAPKSVEWLVEAGALLRRHGQEVCKTRPRCGDCMLAMQCPSSIAS